MTAHSTILQERWVMKIQHSSENCSSDARALRRGTIVACSDRFPMQLLLKPARRWVKFDASQIECVVDEKPVNVRFGLKADICSATADVRFTLNSDRESGSLQKAMSALPPKADMCGATRDVRFGPKADTASLDRLLADAACVRDQAVQARGAVPHWKSASIR